MSKAYLIYKLSYCKAIMKIIDIFKPIRGHKTDEVKYSASAMNVLHLYHYTDQIVKRFYICIIEEFHVLQKGEIY